MREEGQQEPDGDVHKAAARTNAKTSARAHATVRYSLESLRHEVERLDAHLDRPLDAYLIGGGAMAYSGIKDATKDIDLVLQTGKDLTALAGALEALGYENAKEVDQAYKDLGARRYYDKKDSPRWDLFLRRVCRKLLLSPGMVERSVREERHLEKLRINRLAPSDIFIFKSITEREADREDMNAIYARGILWDAVLSEMKWQCAESERVWSGVFYQALEAMDARGDQVPILDDVEELAHKKVGEARVLQRVQRGARTRNAVIQALDEDGDRIEALIDRLLEDGHLTEKDGRLSIAADIPRHLG